MEPNNASNRSNNRTSDDELEVTTAIVVMDVVDIEAGTPVIQLPAVTSEVAISAEDTTQSISSDTCNDGDDNDAIEAVDAEVDGEAGIISLADLESSPIAHLIQQTGGGGRGNSDSGGGGGGEAGGAACTDSETRSEGNRRVPLIERRAEFISATVIKPKENDPMGLGLTTKNDEVLISSISPGSLAMNTPFQVGDRMLSVNAKRCYVMDSKGVAQFMASQVGNVTIVVHNEGGDPNLVESMITKPTLEARCGLGLVSAGRRNLKISNIENDGLFYDSLLNVGDPVVSINGEDCTAADAQDAGEIIARAGRYITIKARTLLETGVVVAAFSCNNSAGSTIPPQIINALDQQERMRPSNSQLISLTAAAVFLIAFLLIAGFM